MTIYSSLLRLAISTWVLPWNINTYDKEWAIFLHFGVVFWRFASFFGPEKRRKIKTGSKSKEKTMQKSAPKFWLLSFLDFFRVWHIYIYIFIYIFLIYIIGIVTSLWLCLSVHGSKSRSVCWLVCHKFLIGLEVILQWSYLNAYYHVIIYLLTYSVSTNFHLEF